MPVLLMLAAISSTLLAISVTKNACQKLNKKDKQ